MIEEVSLADLSLITPQTWTWSEDPVACLGSFREGVLVSGLRMFLRTLHFGSVSIPVFGIGGLVTVEDDRGQGFASDLVRVVIRRAKLSPIVCGVVANSRAGNCVFEKIGFKSLGASKTGRGLTYVHLGPIDISRALCKDWQIDPEWHF